jgi:hypothetical protein
LEPREDEDTKRKSYQLTMLFPPGTDLAPFKKALMAAMAEKFGADQSKWPKIGHGSKDVLKDFAAYNAERKKPLPGDWTGWLMIRASASDKYPPGVVGATKGPDDKFPRITDAREIYGGRWARASIEAYFFDAKRKDGVTFGLKNVQLLKHDVSFAAGGTAAEDDFDNASSEWAGEADAFDSGASTGGTGGDWN